MDSKSLFFSFFFLLIFFFPLKSIYLLLWKTVGLCIVEGLPFPFCTTRDSGANTCAIMCEKQKQQIASINCFDPRRHTEFYFLFYFLPSPLENKSWASSASTHSAAYLQNVETHIDVITRVNIDFTLFTWATAPPSSSSSSSSSSSASSRLYFLLNTVKVDTFINILTRTEFVWGVVCLRCSSQRRIKRQIIVEETIKKHTSSRSKAGYKTYFHSRV